MNNRRSRTARAVAFAVMAVLAAVLARGAVDAASSADSMYRDASNAYQQQNYKLALSLFRALDTKYPDSKHAVRTLEYIAQCENKMGDPYAAFEAYQAIWDKHKEFARLDVITRNQMKIGNHFLKAQYYKKAIEVYQKILVNAPSSEVAPGAQYSLAQAFIGDKDYEAAKAELGKLVRSYPSSQLVDDAAFELGHVGYTQSADAPYDQSITSDSIAAFRRFISDFPSSPKVPEAQQCIRELRSRVAVAMFKTAEYYENIEVPRAAQIAYREVISQYPDTSQAEEARKRLAALGGAKDSGDRKREARRIDELVTETRTAAAREAEEKRAVAASAVGTARVERTAVPAPTSAPPTTAASVERSAQWAAEASKRAQAERLKYIQRDPKAFAALKRQMIEAYSNEQVRTRSVRRELNDVRSGERISSRTPEGTKSAVKPVAVTPVEPEKPVAVTPVEPEKPVAVTPVEPEKPVAVTPVEPEKPVAVTPVEPEKPVAVTPVEPEKPVAVTPVEPEKPVAVTETPPSVVSTNMAPVADLNMSEQGETKSARNLASEAAQPAAGGGGQNDSTTAVTQLLDGLIIPGRAGATPGSSGTVPAGKAAVVDANVAAKETLTRLQEQLAARTGEVATSSLTSAAGRVRRAREHDTTAKATSGTEAEDELKREYATIYYLVLNGDNKMQQGLTTEAKDDYGKALDRLLKLRQKAPTWNSDIVSYRIDYCRERMTNKTTP